MAKFLVDESCPRAVVLALREAGHDAIYAAETNRRASDPDLVALADAEDRVIVTEDFDFGELLIRRQLKARGAIILYMPKSSPQQRAARLMIAISLAGVAFSDFLTIVSADRVRQRQLPP